VWRFFRLLFDLLRKDQRVLKLIHGGSAPFRQGSRVLVLDYIRWCAPSNQGEPVDQHWSSPTLWLRTGVGFGCNGRQDRRRSGLNEME